MHGRGPSSSRCTTLTCGSSAARRSATASVPSVEALSAIVTRAVKGTSVARWAQTARTEASRPAASLKTGITRSRTGPPAATGPSRSGRGPMALRGALCVVVMIPESRDVVGRTCGSHVRGLCIRRGRPTHGRVDRARCLRATPHRAFWLEVRVALVLLYGLIGFFLAVSDRAHLARSDHQAGARPRLGRGESRCDFHGVSPPQMTARSLPQEPTKQVSADLVGFRLPFESTTVPTPRADRFAAQPGTDRRADAVRVAGLLVRPWRVRRCRVRHCRGGPGHVRRPGDFVRGRPTHVCRRTRSVALQGPALCA